MVRWLIGCLAACIVGYYPTPAVCLEADATFLNTEGDITVAVQGKQWIDKRLRLDGRYHKVEGSPERYSFGILSRQWYRYFMFETEGKRFDTHDLVGGTSGLGYKYFTVGAGYQKEFPRSGSVNNPNLLTMMARLTERPIGKFKGWSITIEGEYEYVRQADDSSNDRHDYRFEARMSSKKLRVGYRIQEIRHIGLQGLFIGVSI